MNPDPEGEHSEKTTQEVLFSYAHDLGFKETEEMSKLRSKLSAIEDLDHFNQEFDEQMGNYQMLAEQEIDKTASEEGYPRAQIGLIVASAGIYYEKGLLSRWREALEDAITYSTQMGYIETVSKLMAVLLKDKNYNYPQRPRE